MQRITNAYAKNATAKEITDIKIKKRKNSKFIKKQPP
jgi:hypothetical protein